MHNTKTSGEMIDHGRRAALSAFGNLAMLGPIALSLGVGSLALGGCETIFKKIRNRPMRRDLATLSASDPTIATYRAAVAAMKALPVSDPRSWNAQAEIHFNFCPHGNWFFLPWHRAYLLYFEQICRELTGETRFALPYWNWTCNRTLPVPFLGDATNPLFSPGRSGIPPAALPDFAVAPNVIDTILDETNFLIFASASSPTLRPPVAYGPLEGNPHNFTHGFVGGVMGGYRSPRDPIFWMHHNMIERIWWEWNVVRGNANTNDTGWNQFSLANMFVNGTGQPVSPTVAVLNLAPLLSYQFDNSSITSCGVGGAAIALADQAALRRLLEEGGRTSLRPLRILAGVGPVEVPVGGAAVQTLRVRDAAASGDITLAPDTRLLLQVRDVVEAPTGAFFVRVFINLPGANSATPTTDPHYAGSFAFFSDPAHSHGNVGFLVDATPAVRRLRGMGEIVSGDQVSVQLVAVPQSPGMPSQMRLQVGGLELQIVQSLAPEQRPFGRVAPRP